MDVIKEIIAYLMQHGPALAAILLALIGLAEMVVALTPTEKDDLAVERVGKWVRKFLEMVGLPNKKKGGGDHVKLKDKEANIV